MVVKNVRDRKRDNKVVDENSFEIILGNYPITEKNGKHFGNSYVIRISNSEDSIYLDFKDEYSLERFGNCFSEDSNLIESLGLSCLYVLNSYNEKSFQDSRGKEVVLDGVIKGFTWKIIDLEEKNDRVYRNELLRMFDVLINSAGVSYNVCGKPLHVKSFKNGNRFGRMMPGKRSNYKYAATDNWRGN